LELKATFLARYDRLKCISVDYEYNNIDFILCSNIPADISIHYMEATVKIAIAFKNYIH
jgi:hypothetical protein